MKNLLFLILGLIFSINAFSVGVDRNVQTTIQNFIPLTTVQRDALPSPKQGDFIWNITNGSLNFYNSGWFDVASMTPAQVTEATQYASVSQNGLLSSADWLTFNSKSSLSSLVTQIIYVDPTSGSDLPVSGRGSLALPYQTIQAAFNSVPDATTLNQWANQRIDVYLFQGEYNEAPVVFYKRRSINFIGDGAKILLDFTLNYDPTAQYTGFTYTQAGLPAPWTGGFASPTLSLGCQNNMNGMESGFTTNCMQFLGRVKFTTPNYNTTSPVNHGPVYVTMNGIEIRGGFQMNDSGASSLTSLVVESMNSVISGNNFGLTRAGGATSSLSLKASNGRITSVIGPVVNILKIDSHRIGKLDRTTDINGVTGIYTTGAIQFTNSTSYSGITNSTFVGTGTQNIGNYTGTTNSTMKIDKVSWYGLRALTLDFGGGVTWNITDAEKYLRVIAVNAGSTIINQSTDHILIDPASLIASYTVTMPAKPFDGQRILISSGAFGVTALTLSPNVGQTFASGSAITTIAANSASEYEWNNTTSVWYKVRSTSLASGDVSGPASSVDGEIALFDATTGKLIKSATGTGVVHATSGVYSTSNVDLASEVTGILPRANGGTGLAVAGTVGNVLTSDGTDWISAPAGSGGITSLNTLTAAVQTFANGSLGTAPLFTSSVSTHTLDIPLASGTGVTSGTISKANYDSFVAKVDGPVSSIDGEVALFDSTSGKLIKSATGTGVAHLTSGVLSTSNVNLASEVTGILPTANGGTNVSASGAIGNVLTSDGTNWISSAIPLSINSLNGLTATQQYFATSTTGTDFTVSSSVDTHTLNLPVASAVNTGKLSNADWSTFNSKEPAITVLPTAKGGTGLSSPSTIYKVLTSDGTNWISSFVDYANIIGVPTNVSDFFNDSGYITTSISTIFGSRATPRNVQTAGITTAASHMSNSVTSQDIYVCGSSTGASCDSAVTLTTVNAGTLDGQRMCIIGRDSTNTVTLDAGTTTNIEINGNAVLSAGRTICLRYDLTYWSEVSRNF